MFECSNCRDLLSWINSCLAQEATCPPLSTNALGTFTGITRHLCKIHITSLTVTQLTHLLACQDALTQC